MTAAVDRRIEIAETAIMEAVLRHGETPVVVDSPPGAGKTALVQAIVGVAADQGMTCIVATGKNEQAWDLVRRMRHQYPSVPVQLLHSKQRPVPADVALAAAPGYEPVTDIRAITRGPNVVITTAKKLELQAAHEPHVDLLAVDEAYQLTWRQVAPLLHMADQTLLVGDPGQLPPIVSVDRARFEAAEVKVTHPAPAEILRTRVGLAAYQLPASRRLRQDTVDFVQPAFYPGLPFGSAAPVRHLVLGAAGLGHDPVDRALDMLADGATIVALTLPRTDGEHDPTDPELAAAAARLAARALERGAVWSDGHHAPTPLADHHIGFADQHRASGAELRRQVRGSGLGTSTMVDTPEIWQGLERPFMIVKHPLSGTTAFDEFSLAPGRLCVMTSRHTLGCVLVTRDGVGDDLARHVQDSSERPAWSEDLTWVGYRAHEQLWTQLEHEGRVVRART